jgi:N-acetylneuraminic acid mutarotase
MKYFKLADSPQYDDTSVKADISALQTGKVDKADGMSLIEDAEKERLSTVANYDDTEIKADIAKCATKDVATTTKNGLMSATDKKKLNGIDTSEGYKVFMQTSKPTEDGLWIKGTKKDFMFASYIPPSVDLLSVTLPSVRKYTSAVAINGKAYIFGGEYYRNSSEYGVFSDILEFDPVSGTCTKMSVSLPGKRTCTSAVVINGKAYIFGGNGTKDGNSSNSIFEFDPVAKTCTQMSVSLPSGRYKTSAVAISGKAYIFGGKSDNGSSSLALSDILEFDPVAGTCTKMSVSLPSVRVYTSATAIDGKAYIFGGCVTEEYTHYATIYKFDPIAKTCTQMSVSLPHDMTRNSAVSIDGKAYIFGGYNGVDIDDIVEGSFDWYGFDFAGYYIKPCNSPNGQLTKISSHEISSIEKVYNGQTGAVMEAYSVFNGVATKIE